MDMEMIAGKRVGGAKETVGQITYNGIFQQDAETHVIVDARPAGLGAISSQKESNGTHKSCILRQPM